MCLDCGCHLPLESHGDSRHILIGELVDAAIASGIDVQQAARNIVETTAIALSTSEEVNRE